MAVTDYAVSGADSWADNSSDQFVGVQGWLNTSTLSASAARSDVAQKMSRGGTASKLRVRVVSSSVNGSVTVTLMKGSTATALTVTIPANTSSQIVENSLSSVSFSADDLLSWRIQLPNAGASPPDTTFIQWIACEIAE